MNEFEKIKDKFHEMLTKSSLFEMARSRDKAIRELNSLSLPYITHICKIMLWGNQNEEWLKDWSDEVWNYINQVGIITLKDNKRLKERDYLKEFFYLDAEADWELKNKLESTEVNFIERDNYPEPNFVVQPTKLFSKYQEFVNAIIPQVVSGKMKHNQIVLACRMLLSEEQW